MRLEEPNDADVDEMPREVDFSQGVRGRFRDRIGPDVTMMQIDPNVARAYASPKELNKALRGSTNGTEAEPIDRKAS